MRTNASKVTLCGMIAALSVVIMFLTGIIPAATLALPAIAGCFVIAVVAETSVRYGLAVYAVVSVISVLIVPDREAVLFYIAFFGYYPALYGKLSFIKNSVLRWTLKLLAFNAAMVAETVLGIFLLSIPVAEMLPYGWISIPILAVLLNVVFVLYDYTMNGLIVQYVRRIHPAVIKLLR